MHKCKSWFVSFLFFPSITHNKSLLYACNLLLLFNSLFSITFQFQPHIIFISYFVAFLKIDLLSDLPIESMPHTFAYITFTMEFWPFGIFWPFWWHAGAYIISFHPAMSPHSSHLSLASTSCLSRVNTIFSLCSFLAEHRSSFSQHPLSACLVPVTQELGILLFFSLCFKYFLLHACSRTFFPLYHLIALYFFTTFFHSLALPKAISFPNHQIILMHSNLWTIIKISHFRSREAK